MASRIMCKECGSGFKVLSEVVEGTIHCPHCGNAVLIEEERTRRAKPTPVGVRAAFAVVVLLFGLYNLTPRDPTRRPRREPGQYPAVPQPPVDTRPSIEKQLPPAKRVVLSKAVRETVAREFIRACVALNTLAEHKWPSDPERQAAYALAGMTPVIQRVSRKHNLTATQVNEILDNLTPTQVNEILDDFEAGGK